MSQYKKNLLALTTILLIGIFSYSYFNNSSQNTNKKVYHLRIVAAHNNKVKNLAVPFLKEEFKKEYGAELEIEWEKNGGQNANIKAVNSRFEKYGEETCKSDIIWGGGESIFYKLHDQGRLANFHLPAHLKDDIPPILVGVKLYNSEPDQQTWIAACLSTFGILYNKEEFEKEGLEPPTGWQDLGRTNLFGKVVSVDPARSSSVATINAVILQQGWDKGWEILTRMSANTVVFLEKASSAANNVTQGNGLIAPSIAYYARNLIVTLGPEKIGFTLPITQTIVNPDPIAILKNPPNPDPAKFCIEKILSPEFQSLLMAKKGTPHGPKNHTFGRIGINKQSYKMVQKGDIVSAIHPFEVKEEPMKLDVAKAKRQYAVVSALFNATLIAPHKELKEAWRLIIENGCKQEDIAELTCPLLTEQEVEEMIEKWDNDSLFRKEKEGEWQNQAKEKYEQIIKKHKK